MLYELAVRQQRLVESELPMMVSPPHVRHCLDLLRQSMMCQADTTIEVKDELAGGVHGFGVEHRCKDWDQLTEMISGWQNL